MEVHADDMLAKSKENRDHIVHLQESFNLL